MRKIAVIGLIVLALGALAVIAPASASQTTPNKIGRVLRPSATTKGLVPLAPGDVAVSNDNFATQTFNHFGNPANGSVVGESWIETGVDATNTATNIQAVARTILLPKALRTSLRVELWGMIDGNSTPELITNSATVSSSGALIRRVAAPELSVAAMETDPHCLFFQSATLSIRWSDGKLTSGVFVDPAFSIVNFANPACQQPA